MISKNDFQTMLKSPEHLASLPLEELESLVRHYPWFSLGQTLLAKAYKEQNTYKFSDQLSLASTLSSNRQWLYSYIKSEQVQEVAFMQVESVAPEVIEELPVLESVPVDTHSDSLHSLAEKIVASDEEKESVRVEVAPQPISLPQELVNSVGIEEQQIEEEEEIIETEPADLENKSVTEGMDLLDKSILAAAVSSTIYLEVGEEDEVEEEKEEIAYEEEAQEEELSEDPFIQWLQQGDKPKAPIKIKEDSHVAPSKELEDTQALIDRFIASEPKITPGKAEQYTGVSFAQTSLDDNFEWVTETMAKLYAIQGKVDRARKAYKRLMELHPEKKIYFENQLKALNQRK
jgi:tetratricopeptide (TPR) repeat protein